MDFDEYVAARHGTLLRTAVLLGCPPSEAADVVARVLGASVRRIQRAEDPDPEMYDALVAAIPGARTTRLGAAAPAARTQLVMAAPPLDPAYADHATSTTLTTLADLVGPDHPPDHLPGRPAWQLVPILLALVALLVSAAVVGPGDADPRPAPQAGVLRDNQVPSLFGYDVDDARALLARRRVNVVEQPARACELTGRVLGTDPPTGGPMLPGSTVTLRTAVPSDSTCIVQYVDRALAWRFLDFATGRGPAPDFAPLVRLVVDRSDPATLTRDQAVRRASWDGNSALSALAAAAQEVTRTGSTYEIPDLTVFGGVPPPLTCGVARPVLSGTRRAVTMQVAVPAADGDPPPCPVTVSLYSSYGAIDSVVLYTAKAAGSALTEREGRPRRRR